MTDQELAQLLITVAQKLETQAENISGKAFAEHAAKLQTAVLKLEKLLESTSLTDSPRHKPSPATSSKQKALAY